MLGFEFKGKGVGDISIFFTWFVFCLFLNSMNEINPVSSIRHYRSMAARDGVWVVKKSAKSLILTNLREK